MVAQAPRAAARCAAGGEDRLVSGVAAGLAARTGLDVAVMRLPVRRGHGCGASACRPMSWPGCWCPLPGEESNIASKAVSDRRGIALAAGLGSLLVVVLLIASVLGAGWLGNLAWPLVISVAGVVLIWRNAPADEQTILRRLAEPLLGWTADNKRSGAVLRVSAASLLLIGGLVILLFGRKGRASLYPLASAVLVLAAIVVVLGPWWLRIARDLVVRAAGEGTGRRAGRHGRAGA